MLARIIFALGLMSLMFVVGAILTQTVRMEMVEMASNDHVYIEERSLEEVQQVMTDAIETGTMEDMQPEVSPVVAEQSAAFADAMRDLTGAVPDIPEDNAEGLVVASTSTSRFHSATDQYYATWDDLIRRCWSSVLNNEPFDETGLTTTGDDRVDYETAWTKQKWFSSDKAFEVSYQVEKAYSASTGLRRICRVGTNRFALVSADDVSGLKDRYDAWWTEERLEDVSTFQEFPYEIREGDNYHRAQTDFGTAQGCELIVEYRDIGIARERDAYFFLVESEKQDCQASAGRNQGGVRVNRLPQVSD